jgi:hypothetical protein
VNKSRSHSQFTAHFLERTTEDILSDQIKGNTVFLDDNTQIGYFVWEEKPKQYHAVEYIEDEQLWCFVYPSSSEPNRWVTAHIVPDHYGLGSAFAPSRANTSAIEIDLPEPDQPSSSILVQPPAHFFAGVNLTPDAPDAPDMSSMAVQTQTTSQAASSGTSAAPVLPSPSPVRPSSRWRRWRRWQSTDTYYPTCYCTPAATGTPSRPSTRWRRRRSRSSRRCGSCTTPARRQTRRKCAKALYWGPHKEQAVFA